MSSFIFVSLPSPRRYYSLLVSAYLHIFWQKALDASIPGARIQDPQATWARQPKPNPSRNASCGLRKGAVRFAMHVKLNACLNKNRWVLSCAGLAGGSTYTAQNSSRTDKNTQNIRKPEVSKTIPAAPAPSPISPVQHMTVQHVSSRGTGPTGQQGQQQTKEGVPVRPARPSSRPPLPLSGRG